MFQTRMKINKYPILKPTYRLFTEYETLSHPKSDFRLTCRLFFRLLA